MSYSDQIAFGILRPQRNPQFEVISKLTSERLLVQRQDEVLQNRIGQKIQTSHFRIQNNNKADTPCVVYLHANNGSRLEGLQYVLSFLQQEIELFLFDCTGSGVSDGEYISLGIRESEDLDLVINHLTRNKRVTRIALWGRSMGAVAAMMSASRNSRDIKACVYDSPYSSLKSLVKQVANQKTGIPGFVFGLFLSGVERTLTQKVGTSFQDYQIERVASRTRVPGLFFTSQMDTLVKNQHSQTLFEAYAGEKQIQYISQRHQQNRTIQQVHQGVEFIKNKLLSSRTLAVVTSSLQARSSGEYYQYIQEQADLAFQNNWNLNSNYQPNNTDLLCGGSLCRQNQRQFQFGSGVSEYSAYSHPSPYWSNPSEPIMQIQPMSPTNQNSFSFSTVSYPSYIQPVYYHNMLRQF